MKKKCIIVDDEKSARNILRKYVQETPFLELVEEFSNAIDVLGFLEKNSVDIIFLDIEMPKLKGIHFAELVKDKCHLIFTTAHREFALEGFELNALDYLLKPFSYERFLKAVNRVMQLGLEIDKMLKDHIYVKVNKVMKRIDFSELLFMEGASNYVKFHTNKGLEIVYDKLGDLEQRLPSYFKRVHKSYIVNTTKIEGYSNEYVIIKKKHIPVSETYREKLLAFLSH